MLLLALFSGPAALAEDCSSTQAVQDYQKKIDEYTAKKESATSDSEKKFAEQMISEYTKQRSAAMLSCESKERREVTNRVEQQKCADRQAEYKRKNPNDPKEIYAWKNNKCVDLSQQVKNVTDSDECNNASLFTELKGKNCKRAMETIKTVGSRNKALTEATNASTTAYTGYQAMQATGNQDDAQLRQANIMKAAAFSKLATGAMNLAGAMQLKSAASGAESANSTITEAQKNLAQICKNADDEQRCFYQNATKFGISADAAAYANFERMKRGASQSHDQAEAANAMAKQSMITGAADMLVGLQAMRMAQMAQQNAGNMAPPPMVIPPAPIVHRFGSAQSAGSPNLDPSTPLAPIDYGNPSDAETFGAQNNGRIEGSLMKGGMGVPNGFRSARSQVSGGGGGGSASSGRSGRGRSSSRSRGGRYNTALGEVQFGGGVGFKGGNGGGGESQVANPFADALSKLFPPDEKGKPVVDARQIASGQDNQYQEEEYEEPGVTTSDLTLFEQITAKYRQLDGSGRF